MAELCGLLSRELELGVDILVLNRYGKGESEGQGFRAVVEDAIQKGIPALMAVRDTYIEAWHAFGDAFVEDLPADRQSITDWCRRAKDAPTESQWASMPDR